MSFIGLGPRKSGRPPAGNSGPELCRSTTSGPGELLAGQTRVEPPRRPEPIEKFPLGGMQSLERLREGIVMSRNHAFLVDALGTLAVALVLWRRRPDTADHVAQADQGIVGRV